MTLSISNDWSIFDNRETVTITNKNSSPVTVQDVVRRSSTINIADAAGNVVFSADVTFIIWKSKVAAGFVPKLNARIVDNLGKTYRVDSVNDGVLRSRWLVQCTSDAGQGTN